MRAVRWLPLLALLSSGCGLEQEIFGPAMDRGHVVLPDPSPTIIYGRGPSIAGGTVRYLLSGVTEDTSGVGEDGAFQTAFPGTLSRRGVFIWGTQGGRALLGLLPDLPRQPTVFHVPRHIFLWEVHPSLAELDTVSTTVAMVVARAAERAGTTLSALTPDLIHQAMDDALAALVTPGTPVYRFGSQVASLLAVASESDDAPVFSPSAWVNGGSFLSQDWLESHNDDAAQLESAFTAGLDAAAESISIEVCYAKDTIRVVFQVALDTGRLNGNCEIVDPFKWAPDAPGKRVFISGGVHEDTPVCDDGRTEHCLTAAQIDAINAKLGGWVPNQVAMTDDGEGADAKAGDGIWTVAFDLPYFPTSSSPDGAGVRLAYKYAFGLPGQGWTESEEWPGNQRLLELTDLNDDHIIVRADIFGDESANKDKVNSLKPARGGCGFISWPAEAVDGCPSDAHENRVDIDGDCVPEAWPSGSPITPVTVPCQ